MIGQITLIVVWTVVVAAKTTTSWNTLGLVSITIVTMASVGICRVHHVAHSIVHGTLFTVGTSTHVSSTTGWMSAGAVVAVRTKICTTSCALSIIAICTVVWTVWRWDVAHSVRVGTVRIRGAVTVARVGAGPVKIAESIRAFVAIRVFTTC